MPEAVDRLELVADEEEILGRQQIDQLALEPVRVLELVDEDGPEAPALALPDRRVVAQEVARRQLEIFEVERRLGRLCRGVRVGEAPEEILEQRTVSRRQLVERGLLDRDAGLLVAREPVTRAAARRDVREVEQTLGRGRVLEQLERPGRARAGLVRLLEPRRVVDDAPSRLPQLLDPRLEAGPLGDLEHELAAGGAERLVDAGQHPPQPAGAVGREQPGPLGVTRRAELLERGLERLAREHARLVLVEDPEVRVDAGLEGVRLQQSVAEAVNRRDPGAVELAGEIVPVELGQAAANPASQLAGRPLRVGDREHGLHRQPALAHGAGEPLDEHRRLPRPRPCGDEDEAGRVDRGQLLGVRGSGLLDDGHDLATRHIDDRSHQVGHGNPPFGSCWMSPERIRSTKRIACSFARSVCAQNSSSSR